MTRQWMFSATAALLLISVMIMGCGRNLVGQPIKEELIPKIAVGKTTRAEILSLFGSPFRMESRGDTETFTYLYGTETVWTVGIYTEAQRQADVLTISFDRSGVVSEYGYSKGVSAPELFRPGGPRY